MGLPWPDKMLPHMPTVFPSWNHGGLAMRKIGVALAIGLLAASAGSAVGAPKAAATSPTTKVVIVVGAVEGTTSSYRSYADAAAAEFLKYTSNVVKVYSPNATWANVQAAAQGANVLVYMGHGSGSPNPYNSFEPNADDGMGLNSTAGNGDSDKQYYGENYMAQLGLAPNALVILNHLCYASGDSEPGRGLPSLSVAEQRVDNYASGFLRGNARAVIAEGMYDLNPYIDGLFTTQETIDQLWKTYPWFHNHVTAWGSTRSPGYTSEIDPDVGHPQSDGDYFYRSLVTAPGLTTGQIGKATTYAPTTYHAVSPTRLLDTRKSISLAGPFQSHVSRYFQVTGATVPSTATAVTGNLTVTGQSAAGFLYIGPIAMNDPTSSTLNFPAGDDRANEVTVALGIGGVLWVTYAAPTLGPTANVIFDVTGYFAPGTGGASYVPVTPNRILDTRYDTGLTGSFHSHVSRSFQVTGGTSGVPAKAIAVTGNLTVTRQTSLGFLYLGPTAMNDPTSSTLNFPLNDDRANSVTVSLGTGGILWATYAAPTLGPTADVIFDVTGYFEPGTGGATYVPLTPGRILDTRYAMGLSGASSSHVARSFAVSGVGVIPSGATAVTGNLTVTGQTAAGFLYLGPNSMNNPTSSTLNFPLGDDRANGVTVALGGGDLWVTYAASTTGPKAQVIFDVTGYFIPAGG
jgi:hypothetical protein